VLYLCKRSGPCRVVNSLTQRRPGRMITRLWKRRQGAESQQLLPIPPEPVSHCHIVPASLFAARLTASGDSCCAEPIVQMISQSQSQRRDRQGRINTGSTGKHIAAIKIQIWMVMCAALAGII